MRQADIDIVESIVRDTSRKQTYRKRRANYKNIGLVKHRLNELRRWWVRCSLVDIDHLSGVVHRGAVYAHVVR